ncbi:hypothetical protein MSAN_02074800 [Mycena sanguinolenta]|uniref:Uncharacterized protein n=1 Tax=Mycena sanguinolenta TaxID=230812 RepID=A0A8H6XHT0_9AGAR|nr:hypothetical protein MSAN_02074800 [Mycena sanguinolenta]
MPTLPFPRQFRHGGPEIEGMCPPRRPPLFRRPRSLPTSPPTPTLPCPRRFRRGGPQIHGTCLPQYPLPHRCPAFSVAAAVAADFVVSLPIDLGLASNRREVSPTSASASSTPALNVPAAVAADFAIFSSIHLGCFLKPRDVSPAASTTSTTPALVVPATVAVDLAVSSLIHLGCFSNPRGRVSRSTHYLVDALARRRSRRRRRLSHAMVGLKWKGRVPCIGLRFVDGRARRPAAAPADFGAFAENILRRRRLGSACGIGHTASSAPRAHAPCSEFMAVGDMWHVMHAACLAAQLVSSRMKYESVLES